MTESELVARLEKLERDNRRLKRLGAAALVLVAALGLIAAAQPVPNVIRAHTFEVVDGHGNTRIKLTVTGSGANSVSGLGMIGTDGQVTASLDDSANGVELSLGPNSSPGSRLDPVVLGFIKGQPALMLSGANGEVAAMGAFSHGPNLTLADSEGYATQIGTTDLNTPKTGETHRTSAASIVMLGNDKGHHVIWEAP